MFLYIYITIEKMYSYLSKWCHDILSRFILQDVQFIQPTTTNDSNLKS